MAKILCCLLLASRSDGRKNTPYLLLDLIALIVVIPFRGKIGAFPL
jgi:hypothetical protein